jgi:outer membrane protein TolC
MRLRPFLILLGFAMAFAPLAGAQDADVPEPAGRSNPLLESVPTGPSSSGVLSLDLKEVVERALKNNLSSVLGSEQEREAAAQRLQDLAELLPKIEVYVAAEQRQVNLAAFGFGGFPGVRQVIGPFGLVDARATLSQSILDLERRHNLRESTESQQAAALSNANLRELVALTAVDLYFRVVSSQSRATAVEAQLSRAKALYDHAVDLKSAGLVPGIDVLRAEFEQHSVEQRLIHARNVVQKQKLALARAIGLSLEQEFSLVDKLPTEEQGEPVPAMNALLGMAYAGRADAKASEARIRAADESVKAVRARHLPTLNFEGDYGAIGRSPANSHGTYSLRVEVRLPVFNRTIDAEVLEKEAVLRRRQAERASLQGRIEFEVRSALLDLESAEEQLRLSRQSLTLAQQQLDQAQDRFSAGIVSNLEVVLAQEAVALGDEGVIQGLYAFNIARALLAKATGLVEKSIPQFFPGSSSR